MTWKAKRGNEKGEEEGEDWGMGGVSLGNVLLGVKTFSSRCYKPLQQDSVVTKIIIVISQPSLKESLCPLRG
jgi:hypothetical protein